MMKSSECSLGLREAPPGTVSRRRACPGEPPSKRWALGDAGSRRPVAEIQRKRAVFDRARRATGLALGSRSRASSNAPAQPRIAAETTPVRGDRLRRSVFFGGPAECYSLGGDRAWVWRLRRHQPPCLSVMGWRLRRRKIVQNPRCIRGGATEQRRALCPQAVTSAMSRRLGLKDPGFETQRGQVLRKAASPPCCWAAGHGCSGEEWASVLSLATACVGRIWLEDGGFAALFSVRQRGVVGRRQASSRARSPQRNCVSWGQAGWISGLTPSSRVGGSRHPSVSGR